jgi:ABC-type transport system involved in cytochrome c biogenesis ATPase subunit/N-acetylglutamate synthase-like GNAT family acetyltransferase
MTRRREFFKITRYARRYDRETGKFVIDISYKTKTDITDRTIAVSEAFGLGVDEFKEHVVYDDVELRIGPKDIVYVTGDSGSGKSVLLKALTKDLGSEAINISDIKIDPDKPLIDTVGETLDQGLELLSRVGLNDAFLFVRRYNQLSDGQKYRYRVAKLIESDKQYWIMDEFCSTLDRDTAKIVAFNVQKHARRLGKAVIAATTHTDLFGDLSPSVHIHKRFGKEITVNYYPNKPAKECSIVQEIYIEEGSLDDYKKLAGFHYRGSRIVAPQKIFVLKRREELVGVIVYRYPPVRTYGRTKALGRALSIDELNKKVTSISRVIVHPKYRTIGLGVKLVSETLPLAERPYVETTAVMARYNPFFEKAGMTKIAETKPNEVILEAIGKLRTLGFNPIFLASTKYDLTCLRNKPKRALKVREVLKFISKTGGGGIYRKRIAAAGGAYIKDAEFRRRVESANLEKLAKMLRAVAILAQTKVYLFWKR